MNKESCRQINEDEIREPNIIVRYPQPDEHPICLCCYTRKDVVCISLGTKGDRHSSVGFGLCGLCRTVLFEKLWEVKAKRKDGTDNEH